MNVLNNFNIFIRYIYKFYIYNELKFLKFQLYNELYMTNNFKYNVLKFFQTLVEKYEYTNSHQNMFHHNSWNFQKMFQDEMKI